MPKPQTKRSSTQHSTCKALYHSGGRSGLPTREGPPVQDIESRPEASLRSRAPPQTAKRKWQSSKPHSTDRHHQAWEPYMPSIQQGGMLKWHGTLSTECQARASVLDVLGKPCSQHLPSAAQGAL
eukprot:6053900-Amphidinium_carterae.2